MCLDLEDCDRLTKKTPHLYYVALFQVRKMVLDASLRISVLAVVGDRV